jgi:hypothetical protein
MKKQSIKFIVASDINSRDGIGVEIYRNDTLLAEIFRDDTKRTRTITVYNEDIDLELMEKAIRTFKTEIPWEFIEYEDD